jgi:ribokinase
MVDDNGENCISVALGANSSMQKEDIDRAENALNKSKFALIQLEIPLDVVDYAIRTAVQKGVNVVLNPAPAQPLSADLLSLLYMITPNETEAELLTGIKVEDEISARSAANVLREKGIDIVVITMGPLGAYILSKEVDQIMPCPKVKAVDTTAAGDTFNGALVVGLAEDMPLKEAVEFANKAAAYSVTIVGAQASAPSRDNLIKNL